MSDRQLKHRVLGYFRAVQLAALASFAENDDAIAEADDFGQLRADDDDRQALARELTDDAIDLHLGADIDAARRFVEDQRGARRIHPSAEQDLLLIAAREVGDRRRRS